VRHILELPVKQFRVELLCRLGVMCVQFDMHERSCHGFSPFIIYGYLWAVSCQVERGDRVRLKVARAVGGVPTLPVPEVIPRITFDRTLGISRKPIVKDLAKGGFEISRNR